MSDREDFEKYITEKNQNILLGYDFVNDTYKFMGISETYVNDLWILWKDRQEIIANLKQQRDELIKRIEGINDINLRKADDVFEWWRSMFCYLEQIQAGEK